MKCELSLLLKLWYFYEIDALNKKMFYIGNGSFPQVKMQEVWCLFVVFWGWGGRGEEIWAFVHTGVKNPSYWRQVVAKQKMRNKEKIVGGQIFISYFEGRQLEFESAHVMLDSATSAFFSLHFIWWSMCILKENPTRFINANISSKKYS